MIANSFYVWIIALSDVYLEHLAGRLITHAWTVRIMDTRTREGATVQPNGQGASILNLSINKETKERVLSCEEVVLEVGKTCQLLGMQYYSIIVTKPTDSSWVAGNISYPSTADALDDGKMVH